MCAVNKPLRSRSCRTLAIGLLLLPALALAADSASATFSIDHLWTSHRLAHREVQGGNESATQHLLAAAAAFVAASSAASHQSRLQQLPLSLSPLSSVAASSNAERAHTPEEEQKWAEEDRRKLQATALLAAAHRLFPQQPSCLHYDWRERQLILHGRCKLAIVMQPALQQRYGN
jgi:hypothetical protein